MIRIAICDDDITSIEEIYGLVCAYASTHPTSEFVVRRFHSVYDLLECLESRARSFDIYMLDVLMPILNGIELGMEIRKNDAHAAIVYLTNSQEYALESFRANPAGYMVKPVTREALFTMMDRISAQLERTKDSQVLVRTKDGLVNIRFHQIVYAEYVRHAIAFHLANGATVTSMVMRDSFADFEEKHLEDKRFIRPHASYIVNMDYVKSLTSAKFVLIDDSEVPISKRVHAQVKREYMDYMLTKSEVSLL